MDRTVPITASVTKIPGYNTLTIYQMAASPFWYVRMYEDGKIFRRSTKTIHKSEAVKFAKNYFGQVQLLKMNMLPVNRDSSFEFVARSLIQENKARHVRGELSKSKIVYDEARLEKDILPVFGKLRLSDITYSEISSYLNVLGALARNARTSVEMIDRFYAKPLTAEMKVDILHSQRRPRKAKAPKVDDEGNEIAPKKKAKSAKLDADPAA